MLSYLHAYHAGCLADVYKHGFLSLILAKLVQKDKPLTYMETHAGRGLYDLASEEAQKTRESDAGIKAFLQMSPLAPDHPYATVIAKTKAQYGQNAYPGSPTIARSLLRDYDHLHLMELHPTEIRHLKHNFREENCHCHHRDGYEGVLGIAPPKARRGLVLIDPSFEVKTEYAHCVSFIKKLHKKWAEATIILWYPILETGYHKSMLKALDNEAYKNVDHRVLSFDPLISKDQHKGMLGTGLYMINCPWGLTNSFDDFHALFS